MYVSYEEILAGVKGADNVKRLSSQFIARFFGLFPNLAEQSIDSMLDLCEDVSVDIRKQVNDKLFRMITVNSSSSTGHQRLASIVQGSAHQEPAQDRGCVGAAPAV